MIAQRLSKANYSSRGLLFPLFFPFSYWCIQGLFLGDFHLCAKPSPPISLFLLAVYCSEQRWKSVVKTIPVLKYGDGTAVLLFFFSPLTGSCLFAFWVIACIFHLIAANDYRVLTTAPGLDLGGLASPSNCDGCPTPENK